MALFMPLYSDECVSGWEAKQRLLEDATNPQPTFKLAAEASSTPNAFNHPPVQLQQASTTKHPGLTDDQGRNTTQGILLSAFPFKL